MRAQTAPEGSSFAQKGGASKHRGPPKDWDKQENVWQTTSSYYDPLSLIDMIDKTVLAQTEDQYPFTTVYGQELLLYGFHQNVLTNDKWYKKFNTKVDVGDAIGVTR